MRGTHCLWRYDGLFEDDYYHASCDRHHQKLFCFNEGGPIENGFTFCPYCGRPIRLVGRAKIRL